LTDVTGQDSLVTGQDSLYDKDMTRVYLADSQADERLALRLLLLDLAMEVVGEAAGWPTALICAPTTPSSS
jgi:hypothetical protein